MQYCSILLLEAIPTDTMWSLTDAKKTHIYDNWYLIYSGNPASAFCACSVFVGPQHLHDVSNYIARYQVK